MRSRRSQGLQIEGSRSDFVPEAKAGPSGRRHCGPFLQLLGLRFYLQSISETCLSIKYGLVIETANFLRVSSPRTLDIKCDTSAVAPRRYFEILINMQEAHKGVLLE